MCTPILNLTKDEHVWTIYDTLPPPPTITFSPAFQCFTIYQFKQENLQIYLLFSMFIVQRTNGVRKQVESTITS